MSDEALREAERAFAVDKSAANEARLLVERVRAGKLSEERLRVLAYCGYPAAVLLRGEEVKAPAEREAWLAGLVPFGREVCVQAILAIFPYAFPYQGRDRWFVGDIFFWEDGESKFVNMTLPAKYEHRARIFRLIDRERGGYESFGFAGPTACRLGVRECSFCFEIGLDESEVGLFLTKKQSSLLTMMWIRLQWSDAQFRVLWAMVLAEVRRVLTLWAFASE